MTTLKGSIPRLTAEDECEMELFVGSTHTNTLYSTLSRHTLRPTPYAVQDLEGQIQEHKAATPRATRVLDLDTLIIDTLTQFTHCCPLSIQILLDSLQILTAGRSPIQKQEKDRQLTIRTAHILRKNLREFDSKDLIALGAKGVDYLITFVQTHLISRGSRWMKKQPYEAWIAVKDRLTMHLYSIIRELLRIQIRFDTLYFTNMLQAIADSLTDITQDQGVVFYGLHFLHFKPNLNMEPNSSPLDGVILKILRSRWDRNRLCTRVWAKSHSQRMIMHSAGKSFNPVESAQLTQLAAEVMSHCAQSSYHDLEERARFLQTGSTWLRDLAIDNMSN